MPVLSLILLVAVSAQTSIASHPTQLQAPPDIVIVKWSWNEYSTLPGNVSSSSAVPQNSPMNPKARDPFGPKDHLEGARQGESVKVPPPRDNRPAKRYQYKVVVKNTGTKTIKSLTWNYVFSEPDNEERLELHQFRTEKKIKPRQKQEITQLSFAPPRRVVNVNDLNKSNGQPAGEQVIISRIEYVDGSVWTLGSN
jgi:hypothetical protein